MLPCHGRGRGFEPRRPRHRFQRAYGIRGSPSISKSGTIWAQSARIHAVSMCSSSSLVPRFGNIILTTLLCTACFVEFTAWVQTSSVIGLFAWRGCRREPALQLSVASPALLVGRARFPLGKREPRRGGYETHGGCSERRNQGNCALLKFFQRRRSLPPTPACEQRVRRGPRAGRVDLRAVASGYTCPGFAVAG